MNDLIVIGGGPAGSAAAITAARRGARVLLLEAGRYPRHKVCGEFVSPEALGLLSSLLRSDGSSLLEAAPRITRARLFIDNAEFSAALSPAAASITRHDLDTALWQAAVSCGVDGRQQIGAQAVTRTASSFQVTTSGGILHGRAVVDASGRWSKLNRDRGEGIKAHTWIGLKAHFAVAEPASSTDLYFFHGGYCGVQPIGGKRVNVCAMVRADVAATLDQVFARHPRLAQASCGWQAATEPVATSPLLFRRPQPVRDGVLCAGDAAGFIDPFVGDGIALALRSGTAAAEACCANDFDERASGQYAAEYERQFVPLFRVARRLRKLLSLPAGLRAPLLPLLHVPRVADWLVRSTRAA